MYITYWKIKEEKGYMMRQILIATHGKMASGIRYTLELVVGKMDEITTIDAYVNPEDDVEKMLEEYFSVHEGARIIAFTDLRGGSVNQKLMKYAARPGVTPLCFNTATRSAISERICWLICFPSMRIALIVYNLLNHSGSIYSIRCQ